MFKVIYEPFLDIGVAQVQLWRSKFLCAHAEDPQIKVASGKAPLLKMRVFLFVLFFFPITFTLSLFHSNNVTKDI